MTASEEITKLMTVPTPCYFYNMGLLRSTINAAKRAADRYGYIVHYAMKANADEQILKQMKAAGFGVDCVSGAEVMRAIGFGFNPEHIAFAGVGKSDQEIIYAIQHDIFTINAESLEELMVIEDLAKTMNKKVKVAVRLNPDVDAKTHAYITTGLEENKFGISAWQVQEVIDFLRKAEWVELKGIHFHIGSQIASLEPFKNLCTRINAAMMLFEDAGLTLEHINAGGGLGIDYDKPDEVPHPDFEAFFKVFHESIVLRPHQTLHFELGRSLVANCGDLITKVLFVKKGLKTKFLILDAGMTELIRPALYQAIHKIDNLSKSALPRTEVYDVVGPVCESSDCFGKSIYLPESDRGDIIAIRSAGAYGASMASNYNLRTLHPSVYSE